VQANTCQLPAARLQQLSQEAELTDARRLEVCGDGSCWRMIDQPRGWFVSQIDVVWEKIKSKTNINT
jgi:hypothetical protein